MLYLELWFLKVVGNLTQAVHAPVATFRSVIKPSALAAVVSLTLLACVDDDPEANASPDENLEALSGSIPPRANIGATTTAIYNTPASLALGTHRLLIKAEGVDGLEFGSPDDTATLVLTQGAEIVEADTYWVWTVEGFNGFYAANVTFDRQGEWDVRLESRGGRAATSTINVGAIAPVPTTGKSAIASESKTIDRFDIDELTTDPDPDLDLYQMTVADAVTSGKPSVLVFATPAFCRTAVCGPIVDEVSEIRPDYPDFNFVHVEVYEPLDQTDNELIPVLPVVEWQLPSEPWVFVVDGEGTITSAFEGFLTQDELRQALDSL